MTDEEILEEIWRDYYKLDDDSLNALLETFLQLFYSHSTDNSIIKNHLLKAIKQQKDGYKIISSIKELINTLPNLRKEYIALIYHDVYHEEQVSFMQSQCENDIKDMCIGNFEVVFQSLFKVYMKSIFEGCSDSFIKEQLGNARVGFVIHETKEMIEEQSKYLVNKAITVDQIAKLIGLSMSIEKYNDIIYEPLGIPKQGWDLVFGYEDEGKGGENK